MGQYSTNLTDKQWQVIEKIINPQERRRKHSLRNIMNAILYLLKTGCQWRMIPKNFAPWESVYYYFSKWKNEGIIEELLDTLRSMVRIQSGRNESPSMGIIVDSQGYLMSVAVHEANVHDSKGAPKVIERLSYKFPRLAKILADGGYRGSLADWVFDKFKWELEVVLRPDECPSKFKVIPKRWIVERAFAWLENFRRLTIDYEFHADTAETTVQLAYKVKGTMTLQRNINTQIPDEDQ